MLRLAGLRVEVHQQRRARIEEPQHPLLIPGHHAIIHALQQPVHLVQMAGGFCQQRLSVNNEFCRLLWQPPASGINQKRTHVLPDSTMRWSQTDAHGYRTPASSRATTECNAPFKVLSARGLRRLPRHRRQRQRLNCRCTSFRAIAAVAKSKLRQLVLSSCGSPQRLRIQS